MKNLNKIVEFINSQKEGTKVYIGCDSERFKSKGNWFADYMVVIVVHIEGNKGCKVFGDVDRERDYDKKLKHPRMRLMNEVYRASAMYLELSNYIDMDKYEVEVHLDINPKEDAGSSCVINEAIGYIRGTCNVVPMVKPNAVCASFAADRFKNIA